MEVTVGVTVEVEVTVEVFVPPPSPASTVVAVAVAVAVAAVAVAAVPSTALTNLILPISSISRSRLNRRLTLKINPMLFGIRTSMSFRGSFPRRST